MNQWRRAMASGVLFVVLLVAGVLLALSGSPEIKKKDTQASAATKYVNYLSDSGHRASLIVGAYLIVVAALAFVYFVHALRASLETDSFASRAVASLGVFAAAAISVGAVINASIAGSVAFGDEPLPTGDTIRTVMDLFIPVLLVVFGLACAAIIAIMAVCLMRARTFPRWVAYTGWIGVVGGIAAVEFLPLILPLLWFLVVAIVGLLRPPTVILAPWSTAKAVTAVA